MWTSLSNAVPQISLDWSLVASCCQPHHLQSLDSQDHLQSSNDSHYWASHEQKQSYYLSLETTTATSWILMNFACQERYRRFLRRTTWSHWQNMISLIDFEARNHKCLTLVPIWIRKNVRMGMHMLIEKNTHDLICFYHLQRLFRWGDRIDHHRSRIFIKILRV